MKKEIMQQSVKQLLAVALVASSVMVGLNRVGDRVALAQTPEPQATPSRVVAEETPESVAVRYVEAIRKGDWNASARLMHPDALRQVRKIFRPLVMAGANREVGKMFFKVNNLAQYDRLSENEVFVRLMRAVVNLSPGTEAALKSSKYEIVGHVLEAPDLAHVVYRMKVTTNGIAVTKTSVMSFRKSGASWRGLLSGDIEGMAAMLNRINAPKKSAKPVPKVAPKKPAAGR